MSNENPIGEQAPRRKSAHHPAFLVVYFLIALAFFLSHENLLSRILAGAMMIVLGAQFANFLWHRHRSRAKRIDPPASV
ncbi:hypothetical protein ACTWLT_21495 [Micromonospora sp. ZYX-F-536]|uniref:hypothetical protein n=1 Tax=Micromonospora sp. ZYX-F-536 TaxID=3457629 RepID=UPI0040408644